MTTFLEGAAINEFSPFPDGTPHIALPELDVANECTVTCRITCAEDLVRLGEWAETTRAKQMAGGDLSPLMSVRILYLMGARMDRRLSEREPYTLKVVCDLINSMGFASVQVFCPHSSATGDLLKKYVPMDSLAEDAFYDRSIVKAMGLDDIPKPVARSQELSIVYPDAGAAKRMSKSKLLSWWPRARVVILHKERDERSGKILGTKILQGQPLPRCVIIDDLCDGGATFIGAARVLREAGAERVALSVCHGIFSKGTELPGIDYITTTNSFCDRESSENVWVLKFI